MRPRDERPSKGKLGLQLTDIMPAQRKIVGEISRTAAMRFMQGQRAFEQGSFGLEHVRVKQGQFGGEPFKQRLAFRQRLI